MEIKLEYLKASDIAQYKILIDETFNNNNPLDIYEKSYDENSSSYKIVVAKDGDRVIGSVTIYMVDLFTFDFQPIIEVYNVAVLKAYRGSNTASLLFDFLKEFAEKNGYKTISLTCLADAHRAHNFYEKMGYDRLDRFRYSMEVGE
jgi:GNAT superfamily N-acetyltransferase